MRFRLLHQVVETEPLLMHQPATFSKCNSWRANMNEQESKMQVTWMNIVHQVVASDVADT